MSKGKGLKLSYSLYDQTKIWTSKKSKCQKNYCVLVSYVILLDNYDILIIEWS